MSNTDDASSDDRKGAERSRAEQEQAQQTEPNDICFVMSPFGGYFDAYYRDIFRAAIEAAGLRPERADSLFRPSNIVHDIWHLVTSCKVGLADLTGRNPNVFYELGLAHAASKPVLLVTQDIEDVPFDLRALRVISYDVRHPKWGKLLQEQITQGLQETAQAPQQAVLPTFLQERPTEGPVVTTGEKILLELQQQIDTLRAQIRSIEPAEQNVIINTTATQNSPGNRIPNFILESAVHEIRRLLNQHSYRVRHEEDIDERLLANEMADVLKGLLEKYGEYSLRPSNLREIVSLALNDIHSQPQIIEPPWFSMWQSLSGERKLNSAIEAALIRRDIINFRPRRNPA